MTQDWTTSGPDLHLALAAAGTRHAALEDALLDAIRDRLLAAGKRKPSTPALACDYHATHTTAADENATTVVCDNNGCHALQTSTAQQDQAAEPTVVASQTDK